ncbi:MULTISPECIES: long-chain fatty acid--CoA ligase [unclassified Methylophaga]|jgi:long-chain acyl-CoA synthetase|uniref:AMP-dependent synthetase/ligase n=3 Tax=Methylophaga TaxID=40222 RepID=UPI000C9977AD|nr:MULTISPECIES: long-chain fatty acid--CoA ligase [unclassified Methylophaga]MAK67559.1 long-chain fatty acid--CoA ligase [Methylophaga sp.]MAY18792.1 long-chain fatty acid--CoA ligase [Methylophaga sp.]MBN47859.1 long-chain fatty acid--CoA ligase [Methylophaga sp.]HCD05765.1 long-chain fatty acid--CoA ligase [Methylophaga sp.]|tara:strand:- start:40217 stop:42022 length:1806 start_codon:yes stop_codon:yes gene_type:complete
MSSSDYISPDEAQTLYGLFSERVKRSADKEAYGYFDNENQSWLSLSWQQVADSVHLWQQALQQENLRKGDRVALNLRNSKEWIFFDLAALSLGLVVVPLYPDDRPDNVAYILQDADVRLLLVNSARQWSAIRAVLPEEHSLRRIIIFNEESPETDLPYTQLHEWLDVADTEVVISPSAPDQVASIIYTSGTTGRSKGVMLSHRNMLSVAYGSLQFFEILPEDIFLSFLPLSHTLERTGGYYLPMMAGSKVVFSRSIPLLADDMRQVQPTIMIAVPRIFERIYDRVQKQLSDSNVLRRFIFKLAVNVGWKKFHYHQGRNSWSPLFLLSPLLNKLVAHKFHQRLGGRLRLAVSGGAALPNYAAKMFIGLDLTLLQGYGLTETSPVISVNEPSSNDPSSVGRPIRGVEVRIGKDDELQVKGPGNMLGYWNNHKATAQTIDADGWLHTGDKAHISESGHIHIVGRIKDILVLNNGEKVPPADIEATIISNGLIEQALIVGEGQPYLAALLVINGEKWPQIAQQLGLDPLSNDSLNSKVLQQHFVRLLRQWLFEFPAYARIRRVHLTLQPWTIENGLLTPTLKVKRAMVLEQFKNEIETMYKAASS